MVLIENDHILYRMQGAEEEHALFVRSIITALQHLPQGTAPAIEEARFGLAEMLMGMQLNEKQLKKALRNAS